MSTPAASLEQLRAFATVVEAGGFAAAARRLGRSQPVVSYLVANLEAHLGFALFERGRRRPVLTESGAALLSHARRICLQADAMQGSAENLRRGHESAVTMAVDALFPHDRLAALLAEFAQRFPGVDVTVRHEAMSAVLDAVLERRCLLGISVLRLQWPDDVEAREFGAADFVPVAAPSHALAQHANTPSQAEMRQHVQLALRDGGQRAQRHEDFSLAGLQLWLVDDLHLKLALLRQGAGWGHMPLHLVAPDLERGTLVRLRTPTLPGGRTPFTLLHRADAPPGPLRRWLIERLVAWT